MSKPEFVYVTFIETTPEKLWAALTNSGIMRRYWFGYSVSSDWKVGSPIKLGKDGKVTDDGEVLIFDPVTRLSYSWHSIYDPEMAKETASRVTFDLEPKGKYVKLTVTHQDFPPGSRVLPSISTGWPMVLSSLKSWLETGRPMPEDFVN